MTFLRLGQDVYVVHLMYVLKGKLVKHHEDNKWFLSVKYSSLNEYIRHKDCIGEYGRHIFLSMEAAAKVRDNSMYLGQEISLYCSMCGGMISDWFDCRVCERPSDYCEVDTLC
ncbi:hypothetical protein [Sutcliffiella cohnii]|uniref:hypothetical protein n=1 Tax=Sutcliffiella cohnii TaxID=33932 RepID=UPI002E242A08|nr:hypothetical protein [Sutcliffiella cohnii]